MIIEAIKQKDFDKVIALIEDPDEDVDSKDEEGNSVMKIAIELKNAEIVSALLDNGASAEEEDNGCDLLKLALKNKSEEIADLLFDNEGYPDKTELLHTLVFEREYELLEYLCTIVDDIDEPFSAHSEWLENVVVHDKDVFDEQSALQLASSLGDLKSVKILIDAGADVSFRQQDGSSRTALHKAVLSLNTELIEFLIGSGAEVDAADCWEETPLCNLTRCFHFENEESVTSEFKLALDTLLKFGPTFRVGYCSQRYFPEDMRPGVFAYFLKRQFEIDKGKKLKEETGLTILAWCITWRYNAETLKYFIEQGANIDEKDSNGKTALDHAIAQKNESAIQYLSN